MASRAVTPWPPAAGKLAFSAAGCWPLSGVPGEDAGAVAGFEDELGLGLPDDAVHGDVLQDEVAQGLRTFGGHVEMEVVVAGDVEGLEDAGHAGQVRVEPVDVVAIVAAEPDFDHGFSASP